MITEVENIILNKEYFELTAEELASVNDLVQNAEEYDEMKWFLASTHEALVTGQIEATPELKEKVMSHLNQDKDKRMFWLNGVGVFLWPTDKEVFRRPAFQMSLAALLLIGFLMVYDRNLDVGGEMAINDTTIEDPNGSADDVGVESTEILEEDEISGLKPAEDFDGNISSGEDVGGGDQGLGFDNSPTNLSSELEQSEEEIEKPDYVTNLDGYYEAPSDEIDGLASTSDDESKSINNANNNENTYRIEDVLDKEVVDSKERKKDDKPKKEKDSRNQNNRDKDKKGLLKNKKDAYQSRTDDLFTTSNDVMTDSTSVNGPNGGTTSGNGNMVDTEPATIVTTHNGVYNTASVDGDLGKNNTSDFLPSQMGITETSELKSLFRTFK